MVGMLLVEQVILLVIVLLPGLAAHLAVMLLEAMAAGMSAMAAARAVQEEQIIKYLIIARGAAAQADIPVMAAEEDGLLLQVHNRAQVVLAVAAGEDQPQAQPLIDIM
jgi:hypothetical protein